MISCFLTADGRYDAKSGLIRPTAFPSHFEIRQPQSARAIHLVWQVSAQDGATAIVMVSIWHRSGILRKWQPVTVSNQKVNAVSKFPTHTHTIVRGHTQAVYIFTSATLLSHNTQILPVLNSQVQQDLTHIFHHPSPTRPRVDGTLPSCKKNSHTQRQHGTLN